MNTTKPEATFRNESSRIKHKAKRNLFQTCKVTFRQNLNKNVYLLKWQTPFHKSQIKSLKATVTEATYRELQTLRHNQNTNVHN